MMHVLLVQVVTVQVLVVSLIIHLTKHLGCRTMVVVVVVLAVLKNGRHC